MISKKTKKKITLFLAIKLGWLLVLALGKSLFIKARGKHHVKKLQQENARYIFALWHGRIIVPIFSHRWEGIIPMVSQHSDGEMIARTMERLGYHPVRGSSTRGGKEAFHKMVARIKNGSVGAMIPDGPRGPRHQFKPGTIYMAQQCDAYIIPVSFSAKHMIEFGSWDKFAVPFPFSKTILLYGEPIRIPQSSTPRELAKLRNLVEQRMIELEKEADDYFRK
ncbi:hypothetical protein B6D60_02535 [candidate division KSB1 bacterium 4484_87]|nr:MAG: hypothetical protein B6D60_02535 [candidate division KSB1 bacterium 4484_87]